MFTLPTSHARGRPHAATCPSPLLRPAARGQVHLRDEHVLEAELRDVLLPAEVAALASSVHPPSLCLLMITDIIRGAGLPQVAYLRPCGPGHFGRSTVARARLRQAGVRACGAPWSTLPATAHSRNGAQAARKRRRRAQHPACR
jgi:hypothetical protein